MRWLRMNEASTFRGRGVFDDLVGGLGPGEGVAAVVQVVDECSNGVDTVRDAGELLRRMAWRVMMPKKISDHFPTPG
jgi:hypothetical protein